MRKNFFLKLFLVFSVSLLLISCSGLKYSQGSETANNAIITEAGALIDKSDEAYTSHAAEVDTLKAHIQMLVEKENKRGMNQATKAMWKSVQQNTGNLYDFFSLWKTSGTVSPALIPEAKKKITAVLSLINDWERRKKKGPDFNK